MAVNGIFQAGVKGIGDGLARAESAAGRIAQPGAGDGLAEFVEAAVGLTAAEQQVEASLRVVETANELVGTLIDVLA